MRAEKNMLGPEMLPKSGTSNCSIDSFDVHTRESKNSYSRSGLSDDSGLFAPLSCGSVDVTAQNLDFTQVSVKDDSSSSSAVSEILMMQYVMLQNLLVDRQSEMHSLYAVGG